MSGSRTFDQTCDADRQPAAPRSARASVARATSRPAARSSNSSTARAAIGVEARPFEKRRFADLGLPATDRSTAASPPLGVHGKVADLAGEAEMPDDRPPRSDEPSADTDLAGHEDHVIGADTGTESVIGERTEIGVVGDMDRDARPSTDDSDSASATSIQPRFGAAKNHPVDIRTSPGTDTPQPITRRSCTRKGRDRRAVASNRSTSAATSATVSATATLARGRSTRTEATMEPSSATYAAPISSTKISIASATDAAVLDVHDRRRTAGAAVTSRCRFGDQTDGLEFADQTGDRASCQPRRRDEL